MQSRCVTKDTNIGLEGGEFLLHPEADKIMEWFSRNHKNYDLFSNCLQPEKLIDATLKHKPKRLYISLDGDKETYLHMRGKDGYDKVLRVITALKDKLPVFVMFTLSPYNDFEDLRHVAEICRDNNVFLRVGIYNNISFFDTIDDARQAQFGELKNDDVLTFKKVKEIKEKGTMPLPLNDKDDRLRDSYVEQIPGIIREFDENYDYIKLYENWASKNLRLKCHSILDSVVILPNGDVPMCQNLSIILGNIHQNSLDEVFNSQTSVKTQQFHCENCNQCWVSYHRKYDIILYRTFEKYFGKWATSKMLGYYKWDKDEKKTYKEVMK